MSGGIYVQKTYDNYRTYENDDLSAGATLKVEHTIIVNETDILNLISQPLEKIQAMRDNNVKKNSRLKKYGSQRGIGKKKRQLQDNLTGLLSICKYRRFRILQING